MQIFHQKLKTRYRWYNNWHEYQYHQHIHWGSFLLFSFIILFVIINPLELRFNRNKGISLVKKEVKAFEVYPEHPRIFLSEIPGRLGYDRLQKLREQAQANSPEWKNLKSYVDGPVDEDHISKAGDKALVSIVLKPTDSAKAEYYAQKAITQLYAYMAQNPEGVKAINQTGRTLKDTALVYDWVYDYLSAAQKNEIITWAKLTADFAAFQYANAPYNNYLYKFIEGDPLWGYASFGDSPDAQRYIDSGNARFQTAIKLMEPVPFGVMYRGGKQNGDYGYGDVLYLTRYVEARGTATGEDAYTYNTYVENFFKDRLRHTVYSLYEGPQGTYRWDGDTNAKKGVGGNGGYMSDIIATTLPIMERFPDDINSQYAKFVLKNYTGLSNMGKYGYSAWWFLFDNSNIQERSTSDLPLSYFVEGQGLVLMRSDWGKAPSWRPQTYLGFEIGDAFIMSQDENEQGNFRLFSHGGDLIIDSGQYGGSANRTHYYEFGTIAHNTLTIYDPLEVRGWIDSNLNGGESRDNMGFNTGGQRIPAYKATTDPYEKQHQDAGDMLFNETTPDYTYAMGDFTNAYANDRWLNDGYATDKWPFTSHWNGPKVKNVEREFLYLRPDQNEDEYIVILDRVISTNATFPKKFLLHFINEPNIDGNKTAVIENAAGGGIFKYTGGSLTTVSENTGKVFIKTLLPEASVIRKVGGPDASGNYNTYDSYDFWIDHGNKNPPPIGQFADPLINGMNDPHDPPGPSPTAGRWRIEVMPSTEQTDDLFLNVLYPTSVTTAQMPSTVKVDASNMVGVHIKDSSLNRVALFSSDPQGNSVSGTITYDIYPNADSKHTLFNLPPNTGYNLSIVTSGAKQTITLTPGGTMYYSSSQGTLNFSVSITGVVINNPPTAKALANPISGETPLAVSFTGSGTDTDGTITAYRWNFADGSSSVEQNPNHVYATKGTYTATLTVTDDKGDTGTASITITTSEPDTTPPTINSGTTKSAASVEVVFSEPIEKISAETITNYSIDNNIIVSAATIGTDLKTVTLLTSNHTSGLSYTLTVNNIKDRATKPNIIVPNTTFSYTYAPALLKDDFASGTMTGWTIVDEGTVSAPSSWSVVNGVLTQSSNIYGGTLDSTPYKPGTFAHNGDINWKDYEFNLRLKSDDDDGIGVMFRYRDNNNYYRFMMDSQRSYRRLTKTEAGVITILAQDTVAYTRGQWYNLKIKVQGDRIEVYLDGSKILEAIDAALPNGKIALYSWGNAGSSFDDVEVLSLGAPPPDTTPITLWAIGDSEKIQPDTLVRDPNYHWSSSDNTVRIKGARNEVVAFQVVLRNDQVLSGVDVQVSDLTGPATISKDNIDLFRQYYQKVTTSESNPGDLPINQDYPDPLIPFKDPYNPAHPNLGTPFTLNANKNQPIWIDLYVPKGIPAGTYRGTITVSGQSIANKIMNLELEVWNINLPDETHLESWGWIGGGDFSKGEEAGFSLNDTTWNVLKEYQKMAKEHRLTLGGGGLDKPTCSFGVDGILISCNWTNFDKYIGQILSGSLYTEGIGQNTPAHFYWMAPYSDTWSSVNTPYNTNAITTYFQEVVRHFKAKGWNMHLITSGYDEFSDYNLIKWYADTLQKAVGNEISYLDTAHADRASLPDLLGYVDLWSPNARNYNPTSIQSRQKLGEYGWFYHSAEPYLGHHVVNTYGLSMLTWPMIAWKYGVNGVYFWSINYWPYSTATITTTGLSVYDRPSDSARWGNGVLFYPGKKLTDIGLTSIQGPVPSFRLKTFRSGAQMYEYSYLAKSLGKDSNLVVDSVIKDALKITTSMGLGNWSHNPDDWYKMRDELAKLIISVDIPLFVYKLSDFNQDQKVDQLDFDILKQEWARTDKPKSDLNQDGIVDTRDLGILMSEWSG